MNILSMSKVGPIGHASVEFGDLTILVGTQASGKSVFLQTMKLVEDLGSIQEDLALSGVEVPKDLAGFSEVFYGEGMQSLWSPDSQVAGHDLARLVGRIQKSKTESVFYIPAQRVLSIGRGWPRPFSDFSLGDPYVLRHFSETLRILMESRLSREPALFPREKKLKAPYRTRLDADVFAGLKLKVDRSSPQKRITLSGAADQSLPFSVWTAGQREFVPLLMGLYELMQQAAKGRAGTYETVVIEEPEMGLHARAIESVMLLVLELLWRGYKVCISTHSLQLLELAWAWRRIQQNRKGEAAAAALERLLGMPARSIRAVAKAAVEKEVRVYHFKRGGESSDISDLDPASEEAAEAEWGGLSTFSGRATAEVSSAVASNWKAARR